MRSFTTHLHLTRVALGVAAISALLAATSAAGERRYTTVPFAHNGKTGVMAMHSPETTNRQSSTEYERRYTAVPFAHNGKTGVMTTFVPRRSLVVVDTEAASGRAGERARR